jgi:acetylglutamate kinase
VRATLLKLGGELLENQAKVAAVAKVVARADTPLVIVHGGGREIDAALAAAGIAKRQVDGLRVTDGPTLDIVVAVLAGGINTRVVAAINAAGGRAVGLTGADAGVAMLKKAPAHRSTSGDLVDLGLVGEPLRNGNPALLTALVNRRFVPVIACIGASRQGRLFNVNADTLAGNLAARLAVNRLVIAGGTPGVLDEQGKTIPALDPRDIRALVRAGTASAGMVAKLTACEAAVRGGVKDVLIVDGRDAKALARSIAATDRDTTPANGTRVTR